MIVVVPAATMVVGSNIPDTYSFDTFNIKWRRNPFSPLPKLQLVVISVERRNVSLH
jgi:hypothetical protein